MSTSARWLTGIAVFIVLLLICLVQVNPGQQGVMIVMGKLQEKTLDEGLHFRVPIISSIKKVSIKIQKDHIDAGAATKDLQEIKAGVVVNWSINPQSATKIYRTIGNERAILNNIIIPATNEAVKASTAKRSAENILVERAALKTEADEVLKNRLKGFGINLIDLSFVNFEFSKEFNVAIEQKQIAEQDAKKAIYEAEAAKNRAESQINEARGRAESKRLLSLTVTPKVLALEFFEKWDGRLPAVVGSNSNLMMTIDEALKESR